MQALLSTLSQLPKQPTADGPLTLLPSSITQLPRAKPLPKPKLPTKWEKFAVAKGIQKKKKDKKVWDEEKQEWVNRWGWKGKNREKEGQWLDEVKANAGDFKDIQILITHAQYLCLSNQTHSTTLLRQLGKLANPVSQRMRDNIYKILLALREQLLRGNNEERRLTRR